MVELWCNGDTAADLSQITASQLNGMTTTAIATTKHTLENNLRFYFHLLL